MTGPDVMFPEEQQQMSMVCARLARDANAKAVLLIGRDGQPIADAGDVDKLDVTSLASLTAGNVAATGGIAKLLREKEFASQFHEGEKANIHITLVGNRVILVVIFDERSSLGLVRLRVKKASDELVQALRSGREEGGRQEPAVDPRRDHRRRHRQPVQRLTPDASGDPMSFINYTSREINCKIVYYGPGLCGKTTNLQYIYEKTNPDAKGKMISLATETERTLFFDFLPLSLGEIRGFKTRFHLYTVPGQVFYDASRKLILKGVDGVVFVGRLADRAHGGEHRVAREPAPQPDRAGLRPRQAPVRRPVQQARPARTPRRWRSCAQVLNPTKVPEFEAVRDQRRRRVRHAQGRRQARPDRAQARQLTAGARTRPRPPAGEPVGARASRLRAPSRLTPCG